MPTHVVCETIPIDLEMEYYTPTDGIESDNNCHIAESGECCERTCTVCHVLGDAFDFLFQCSIFNMISAVVFTKIVLAQFKYR